MFPPPYNISSNIEDLKVRLQKIKDREKKIKEDTIKQLNQSQFASILSSPTTYTTGPFVIGELLSPFMSQVMFGVKRTHTGKYRFKGKTYKTKNLAIKARNKKQKFGFDIWSLFPSDT